LLYLLCIIGANWLLATFGVVTLFGLAMPAGVFAAGVSFGARDWLQESFNALPRTAGALRADDGHVQSVERPAGRPAVLVAIAVGAVLSTVVSPLRLALASGLAFLFSETADMLVYSPLRANHRAWAVTASNTVGAIIDSALFLWLAGFSMTLLPAQVLGKALMILPALLALWLVKRRRAVARTTVAVVT
jgi:uncharacterized PurR-regulated membrane protein YhhQ (DUF165 family)